MAVVFISPRKQQKRFFTAMGLLVLGFVAVVSVLIMLAGPKKVEPELVFNRPKVNINFAVLDTEEFKELEPFEKMALQFSYSATTAKNKRVNGFMSSESIERAREVLEGMGLTQINIEEVKNGRENPFVPY